MEILIPFLILGGLGIACGLLLGFASKKFAVKEDPKQEKLREVLPGANCGGCGYAGCDAYAKAVAAGNVSVGKCSVGGNKVSEKMAQIMGVDSVSTEPMVAFVACGGELDKADRRFKYFGTQSCKEAAVIPGGGMKVCRSGCLGLGECVAACRFDAIHIVNGVALVDREKCVACGACMKACPKHLISLVPKDAKVRVMCNNCGRGLEVKNSCKVGCIGCSLCARNCPEGAITMKNNLPVVDHSKCTGCGVCTQKCPVHAIRLYKQI